VIALIAPADLAVRVPDTRAATFPDDIRDEQPETICGPRLASGRADVRVLAAGGSTESSAANQSVQGTMQRHGRNQAALAAYRLSNRLAEILA
jgi:hypothetical protein